MPPSQLLLLLLPLLLPAHASNSTTFSAGGNNLCPEASPMCHCSINLEGKLTAMCMNKVSRTPTGLPANLLILTIYCNAKTDSIGRPIADGQLMGSIDKDAFRATPSLQELTISRCPLSELPPFLFANLTRLTYLSLESLLLDRLHGSLLMGSNNLNNLHLMNMPNLKEIDPILLSAQTILQTVVLQRTLLDGLVVHKMLAPLRRSLKDFTWTFNRLPVTIPSTTFKQFRLRQLNLRHNKLTDLEFLVNTRCRFLILTGNVRVIGLGTTPPFDFSRCRGMRGLIELHLTSTNLRQIHDNSFNRMKNLRKLYLRANQLREVPVGIYSNHALVSRLSELDLANNQIQMFPEGLRKLFMRLDSVVALDGNPLHCNCEAAWLLTYPKQLQGLRCGSAPAQRASLRGSLLTSVSANELVCIPPSKPVITATNMVQMKSSEWEGQLSTFLATPAGESSKQIIEYKDGQKYIPVSRGQTLSLRCVSHGDPTPELYWLFSWGAVAKREADKDRTITSNEISAKIPQERLGDTALANITCRASNRAGTKDDIVFLQNMHPAKPVTPAPSVDDKPTTGGPLSSRPSVALLFLVSLLLLVHRIS